MMRIFLLSLLFVLPVLMSTNEHPDVKKPRPASPPPFQGAHQEWVDSVFNSMSQKERIGQLFMVAAYSQKSKRNKAEIEKLIQDYKIGGLIFFQGTPKAQAKLTNHYQKISQTPLMIGIDGEWGLEMRLDNTVQFPYQMQLGALQNDSLIYEMGQEIARQCKRLGIHVNFAPVVDINNNPNNPVINYRSFGEQRERVAEKGVAYMKGMQNAGVLANAKHFPGHGDTDRDSHKGLPVINHDRKRLDSIELYPFRALMRNGLASTMVAHLSIPALDNRENMPTTLSSKVVQGLLKDSMGFQGLVFTDALNMKGVSKFYDPGDVEFEALKAGNDVLLFAEDVPKAIQKIEQGIEDSVISKKSINKRVKKILHAKAWTGLNNFQKIKTKNLQADLNPNYATGLNYRIAKGAVTVAKDQNDLLPILPEDEQNLDMASLVIGNRAGNSFQRGIKQYNNMPWFSLSSDASMHEIESMDRILKDFDRVIVGVHTLTQSPYKGFGVTSSAISMINKLADDETTEVIVAFFGNPYGLAKFEHPERVDAWIEGYQDTKYTNKAAASLIFGAIPAQGQLPVTANDYFPAGSGKTWSKAFIMGHSQPSEMKISQKAIDQVDSIARKGIAMGAYPGCQILMAKNGEIFYQKSFGWHTYEQKKNVANDDIYDLASITKVAATTTALMTLVDYGKFSLDSTLGDYLPELVGDTKYASLKVRDIMAHQGRLVSWIPFYFKTLKNGQPAKNLYRQDSSAEFSSHVTGDLFLNKKYEDTIFQRILGTRLHKKAEYRYSDLGYYFMKKIVEKQSGMPLDVYVQKEIYQRMGLDRTTYNPLYHFDKDEIPPTEDDDYFRHERIQGWVHDMGAAMLGGVGGHAGLFSNAEQLAALFQMFLNNGTYGGRQYIDSATLAEFTKCQFCPENRRGAGFDKPVRSLNGGPTCELVSLKSFGHSGFTGTLAWVDPSNGINYIFLSNRTFPDMENKKLIHSDIRTKIQRVIYKAVQKAQEEKDGKNVP